MKKALILTLSLILAGGLLFGGALLIGGARFSEFEDVRLPDRIVSLFEREAPGDRLTAEGGVYSLATVGKIVVNWTAGSVRINPADSGETTVSFYETGEFTKDERLVSHMEGTTLFIDFADAPPPSVDGAVKKTLYLSIPGKSVCDLSVETASANVTASDLSFATLSCTTVSGDIKLTHPEAKELFLKTTSGKLSVARGECTLFAASSVSGAIDADVSASEFMSLRSESGAIHVSDNFPFSTPSVTVTNESGDVTARFNAPPALLRLNVVSGNVILGIPKEFFSFRLFYVKRTGAFSSELPLSVEKETDTSRTYTYLSADATCQLEVRGESGDFRLVSFDSLD